MKPTLVTGVRDGNIGFATARRIAEDGGDVVVADVECPGVDVVAAIGEGLDVTVSAVAVDVTDMASIEAMLDHAFGAAPGLANLVACAGIADPLRPLDITPERWDRVMDINLRGTFFCLQGFIQRLVDQGRGGAIATVSSVSGRTGGRHNGLHYAASKAAIISISRGFARAFGEHGIRVNAVAPGIIDTPMSHAVAGSDEQARATPLGRWGSVWEVADALTYAVSDRSSYMTGAVMDVNGGQYSA